MGAELSIEQLNDIGVEVFNKDNKKCENIKHIFLIKLKISNSIIPNKIPLNLEIINNEEYFNIEQNGLIFYKFLLIGKIIGQDIFADNTTSFIYIQNIGIENFIFKQIIEEIKKNEFKKKIIQNEFKPGGY